MAQITSTCLFDAVKRLDYATILELLWCGIDINCRDSNNATALHYLPWDAGKGDIVHFVISILVAFGANINARDMRGMTPLHTVILPARKGFKRSKYWSHKTEEELDEKIGKRQMETLRLLVQLDADVNARFNIDVTSLTRAIQFGNVQAVEMLIKLGVNVNSDIMINWSLLNSAVCCGNKELIKCLIDLGADIESKYSYIYPLHQALKTQTFDLITVLVQNGADVNNPREDNITPIIQAFKVEREDMIDTLAQLGSDINSKVSHSSMIHEIVQLGETDWLQTLFKAVGQNISSIDLSQGPFMVTALGIAVEESDFKMAEICLKNEADVNVRYEYSCPPLFTAMRLGHVDMVTELIRLGADLNKMQTENTTALMRAVNMSCPRMLDLLLTHGGDVNLTYNIYQTPIQDAVRRGDTTQVKTLAKLGADKNAVREEGIDLLYRAFNMFGSTSLHEIQNMEIIKMLVEAGIDLNKRKTNNLTTLLHDAVKLGDTEMVHTLVELGIDVDETKSGGYSPLFFATQNDLREIIKHLVSKGANINQSISMSVPPLYEALQLGNIDMVSTLIDCGADQTSDSSNATALYFAILLRNKETVKCLLECGADMNKVCMHTMVEYRESLGVSRMGCSFHALHQSIQRNCYDITETLLMFGAHVNSQLTTIVDNSDDGPHAQYPLHAACKFGHIDLVRLLMLEGGDVDKCDSGGRKPLEYLPLVNTVDYHVIKDLLTSSEVLCEPRKDTISVSECKNMKHLLCTPGIGDVRYIPTPQSSEISSRANKVLDTVTTTCRGQLKAIGSAAEGTKVGLPAEMDFMIEIQMKEDDEEEIIDRGNGYIEYEYSSTALTKANTYLSGGASLKIEENDGTQVYPTKLAGSADFHKAIMNPIFKALSSEIQFDEKIIIPTNLDKIKEKDRKACSSAILEWDDGNTQFDISVDLVPCLYVNNWPEGAITKTCLMDYEELRSHGYVLVPKPPHVKSNLAKEYTKLELQTLWKISFPHLETKHMQHLEQRVKDVYTTAKCLRNPDVCRILIRDDGSLPRPVDKYITSYLLKMCFFENIEYFQDNELSLEAMVCKVYQDLVGHLSEGFVPIFFLPKVNALGGGTLDTHKCVQVAKTMAQFVRGLYLRDSDRDVDTTICDEDEEITVYQRKPTSVYKVQDVYTPDTQL